MQFLAKTELFDSDRQFVRLLSPQEAQEMVKSGKGTAYGSKRRWHCVVLHADAQSRETYRPEAALKTVDAYRSEAGVSHILRRVDQYGAFVQWACFEQLPC